MLKHSDSLAGGWFISDGHVAHPVVQGTDNRLAVKWIRKFRRPHTLALVHGDVGAGIHSCCEKVLRSVPGRTRHSGDLKALLNQRKKVLFLILHGLSKRRAQSYNLN